MEKTYWLYLMPVGLRTFQLRSTTKVRFIVTAFFNMSRVRFPSCKFAIFFTLIYRHPDELAEIFSHFEQSAATFS